MRAEVVDVPIETESLIAEVARETNGATAVFLGTVRSNNDGRDVTGIEYSAYREMAVSEMSAILIEARERFQIDDAVAIHRVGTLGVGEVSIAIVVAAPHRAAAFDSLRHVVEETKRRAPIWKLEHYVDGTREWVGASTRSVP